MAKKKELELDPLAEIEDGINDGGFEDIEAPAEKLDPEKHILVDLSGGAAYSPIEAPAGWARDRRLLIGTVNVEHSETTPEGVWCYSMKP